MTFVNFTVTRSSLQSQCLNQVLKAERPDIDEKRSDLLKLQGKPRLAWLNPRPAGGGGQILPPLSNIRDNLRTT